MCCESLVQQQVFTGEQVDRHLSLDPVPASVGLARRFVAEALSHLPQDPLETLLLLTSELVTNAILHARTPVELGIAFDDLQVLVAVADRVPTERSLEPRTWSGDRPGGRGLALVAEMSATWGTDSRVGGKAVWFLLPVEQVETLRAG